MKDKKLIAVLCGMPFSGTTYLSRIVCSHAAIDAGFECGLLFEENPRLFTKRRKFYNWMMSHEKPYNWKLSSSDMEYVCDTDDFYESYNRIVEKCHLFNESRNATHIIDKTPAYIYRLRNIMPKVPETPFIVIRKSAEFQYSSYKNRGRSLEEFIKLYEKQIDSLNRVKNLPILNKRLLILNFSDIQTDLDLSISTIFDFLKSHSDIKFNPKMIIRMRKSLELDINSNKKKLRKKFNYNQELKKYKQNYTSYELENLAKLTELETSFKS